MAGGKIRIYDLSGELNLDNKEILDICESLNIAFKSLSSTITLADAERIKATLQKHGSSLSYLRSKPLPVQIKNLSIKGFRRLQSVNLTMKRLTVLIGANGAGKTSFLDVISLLSASARGDLKNSLQRQGGLKEILTRGKVQELEISVEMEVQKPSPFNYHFVLSPQGFSYNITEETLTQQQKFKSPSPFRYIESQGLDVKYFSQVERKLLRPNWDHNPLETSLSQVPKMYREPENLRKSLADCTYYAALDVSERSPIRLPQPMRPASLPGKNGESLISCRN